MTTRERLHQLVDELSEREADAALQFIAERREDPMLRFLDSVPPEDEPISDEEEAAVQEARDELAAGGSTIPLAEIKRELGHE